MCNDNKSVSLGFTKERVAAGTHMCLIFTEDNERRDSLLKFLLSGMQEGERAACFSEDITEDLISTYLDGHGISYDDCKTRDALSCSRTSDVYFQNGVFDPDRMLRTLSTFYQQAKDLGFTGVRVIGEMSPEVEHVPGGDRLLEYESRVSLMVKEKPVTTVCQYDAKLFSGSAIMEVLKVHPKMIINGVVVHNPFFIEPEEYLQIGT